MRVAILIPTYARVRFLNEALHCALSQDHEADVIIHNDCAKQTLKFDHPRVRIHNDLKERPVSSLGFKRTLLLSAAAIYKYDRVCWLDDDDLCLPSYVSGLVEAAGDARVCIGTAAWSYYKQNDMAAPEWQHFVWQNEMLVHPLVPSEGEGMFGGYPHIDSGEDQVMRSKLLSKPGHKLSTNRAYVYRWGQGSFHISGSGRPDAGKMFHQNAENRMISGEEPSGAIHLEPKLEQDYFSTIPGTA